MSTVPPKEWSARIGETAGAVWRTLDANGPMSLAKLIKTVGEPRDVVMQALGWLGREDKVLIKDNGRTREVSLR